MFKAIIATMALLFFTGCHSIYFHNGKGASTEVDGWDWHHGGGLFGLFEFSEPKNLETYCPNKSWKSVRTRDSFLTGFINNVVPYGIYTPIEFSHHCGKRVGPAAEI